ncbi:M20/M25/M40 family metallo-hydrolase [Streptomyces sp. NPDC019224]|uniref:M20/M25/M40 family metallo-hydrolase n=1 Tax=Streptomyces sp. NPDC019224 TaxID=3154484 RepID=UPI0033C07F20
MTDVSRARLRRAWWEHVDELVRCTSELVRRDTTNPPGNESLVTDYVARELAACSIDDVTVLAAEPGRANLVARLPGDGTGRPLMLLGHADVVAADGEGWPHPPFSGHVDETRVWGRGTLDMKGHIAAYLLILRLLTQYRVTLRRDVVLVVTADEESGSRLGARWLADHHPEAVAAEFAFNEGGGQRFATPGGPLYTVQVAEKGSARLRVTARGTGGHASIPRPGNPVFRLAEALTRLSAFAPPSIVSPAAEEMLRILADHHTGPAREELLGFAAAPSWHRALALPIDPVLREFVVTALHNTAVPTLLSGGRRFNAVPDRVEAVLDGRVLPGQHPHDWCEQVREALGPGVEVELVHGRAAPAPVHAPAVLEALRETVESMEPGAGVLPYINSAATDARALPDVAVHGFFPSRSDADIMRLAHGIGEHARIDDLAFGGACLLDAVLRLAT